MVLENSMSGELLLVGRILFGLVIAFTGLNHFLDMEGMVGYAEAKGVPAASVAIPVSGAMLLFSGLGIALGVFPILAAGALVVFFVVVTPKMHDFWNAPEEQKQGEVNSFLKNVGLLGASLVFLALGATSWPYAVNLGLF
ncbi:DoxX family protein [Halostagnicola sp. A-GB9-2]|uniref:DoxX family protein n=1 Tax=Halostagnicola sp. A-GB9-2 TaxID=3048066 RepID=UPI0024BFB35F|nr:DoxX family protein [Halostagnicola sp. A-GB9-2]MDJ1432377.1 DoxX family protein [Halostagnicola sp. A-GB9-2]